MNGDGINPPLLLGALAASGVAHGLVLVLAGSVSGRASLAHRPEEVEITVVERPAPEPAATPAPLPVTPQPAPPRRPSPPRPRLAHAAPPPPSDHPPPPVEEAPQETPPPVVMTGVPLSATSSAGAVAAPVGNTMRGGPAGTVPGPAHPYKAQQYAESYAVTEEPVFLDNVSADRVRRFYPEEARQAKEEAAVLAKLTVDDDGSVVKVVIVSDPGHGFAAAATKLARLYRFKPARVDGKAVATEIPFTIRFELD